MQTKSQQLAIDVATLLRARNPLLWVTTREESRVERYLVEAAAAAGYVPRFWDCAQGVSDLSGNQVRDIGSPDIAQTLGDISGRSKTGGERGVWILRDLPVWLQGAMGMQTLRALRNLVRTLPGVPRASAQALIVLSPSGEVPPELSTIATVIDWPLPEREEIAAILDAAISALPDEMQANAAPNGNRDAAIAAAIGLSGDEASSCYAKSLVQSRRIDPVTVSREKKRVIAREKVLEWVDPISGGLEAIGGLDALKGWLTVRRSAYSQAAREYGLPSPKGVLLVGVPGCGKTLSAKCVAAAWGLPLLRVDLGAIKDKYVGASEANLRKVFQVIQSLGRCVVWFDEIEKSLAGATQGAADGGVSSDALGAILSWMQDRTSEAFVIATANDVSSLPPELLRKGRFDEVFFVDCPTESERVDVLKAALKANNRTPDLLSTDDLRSVTLACQDFTGSEIAALVPEAMFKAFSDGKREINAEDLISAAKTVVPLTRTAADKIARLRDWAKGRARPATSEVTSKSTIGVRALDI